METIRTLENRIREFIKYIFTGKINDKSINKDINVTENGGFGISSENIFKDKEKAQKQIISLKKIIKENKI